MLRRLGQFVLVVFIGVNITFFITHATPIDPVEQTIAASTSFGSTSPEAIALMRQSLRELYGLQGGLLHQYWCSGSAWSLGDFGPSLSAFPTPVSVLIWRALPWTAGLLCFATVLAWCLGNLLGGLAGYYRDSRLLRLAGVVAMGFHPIPYYIVAFVLLIVFGYLWPVLPISGGAQMNLPRGFDCASSPACCCTRSCRRCRWCWSASAAGSWGCARWSPTSSPRTTSPTPSSAASAARRILRSYVMRNALVPQVTGLAISLGGIFNGAIITEQVFGYPGIGTLLVDAVHAGDYSLVLGVATVSIIAVAASVLLIDLAYPLLDPRVKAR